MVDKTVFSRPSTYYFPVSKYLHENFGRKFFCFAPAVSCFWLAFSIINLPYRQANFWRKRRAALSTHLRDYSQPCFYFQNRPPGINCHLLSAGGFLLSFTIAGK